MNKLPGILWILLLFLSCQNAEKKNAENPATSEIQEIIKESYELSKPTGNVQKLLILFGGFPEKAEEIKREFTIREIASENQIAVLYMNYNQKLWLEESEKQQLAELLQNICTEHQLPVHETYIGGFSSGGNVALLIGAFMAENKGFTLAPRGVFIVDSPIDLVALYRSSEKNIARNFSEVSVQESTWLLETLGKQFGNPDDDLSVYEKYAIYTSKTGHIDNLKALKNTKIRLYTEPDTLWWKENRKADYDQLNACYIKLLSESLVHAGFSQVEYIATEKKGYRANGDRHPHSWSIVDKKELITWMME
ncbi:MAG: hypothetical protein EAZ89_16750 [Bacteroidetes bacterium]|nr:MAG: hypothetical protein EAZ89_16750 [Bacteroidota bacterium]